MMTILKKITLAITLASSPAVLSSCWEGVNVPFYVGCLADEEPFSYIDSSGQLTGLEVEIMKAIAEDQDIWIEFETCTQEEILNELDSRKHKIECGIGMIEWTSARESLYSYVSPGYFTSSLCTAVAAGNTAITSRYDLKGKSLGVRKGSLPYTHACSQADSIGFKVVEFETSNEAVKALESGLIDAVEEEYDLIQYKIAQKKTDIKIIENGVKNLSFAIITQKDEDKTFRGYLNTGLVDIYDNGKLQAIIDKYIKEK